jgi:hypothetical protein
MCVCVCVCVYACGLCVCVALTVETVQTLAHVFGHSAVSVIDFLSLDVEGAELEALLSINWHAVTIRVLLIERNHRDLEIERLLVEQGMILVRELAANRLWVHASLLPQLQ